MQLNDGILKFTGDSANGVVSMDRDGNVNVPCVSFEAVPDPEQIVNEFPEDGTLVDLFD